MRALPLTLALLLLVPSTAFAGSPEDTTPGGSAAAGFPIALVVLAVAATVLALVWRAVSKRKQDS